jgi:hypothetical protein
MKKPIFNIISANRPKFLNRPILDDSFNRRVAFQFQLDSISIVEFQHITTRKCYFNKIKNIAECLYHTFIITLFNWSNFFC